LVAAADAHATDMLCSDYFGPIGLNGSTTQTRVKAQGYNATLLFEELYALSPANGGNPLAAFNWWMNNTQKRSEILNSNVTELGIAYVSSEESLFGGYFVLILAKP
jgi:uncharacterized protein YkwD